VPSAGQAAVAGRLRTQADWCHDDGERLYAELLRRAAEDVEAGGPAWDLLAPHAAQPGTAALALRFLAALRRLVLDGRLPELAWFYGGAAPEGAWPEFRAALVSHREELAPLVARPCQTNEVGRSAALLGGFLEVAAAWKRPLRLLEIGASAGLNLRWDRYRYEAPGRAWGDPDSPVCLAGHFVEPPPMLPARAPVAERSGCDLRPLDATTAEGALSLASFVWPSRPERMTLLRGALEVARQVPAAIEQAGAGEWLARKLAKPVLGVVTVVFHSVFVQYVARPERERILSVLRNAGRTAAVDAPVVWLRMEPGPAAFEVRLTAWPGGRERLLATSGPHGRDVRWLDSDQE
jgi:hypothetical protein